jgi:segregation and condensation protein A
VASDRPAEGSRITPMGFQVRTEAFEGPFDLLLHLILKDEVDLYSVQLTEIVDAYLVEVARLESCDLELATEFLLIAATLVELKCRRLLPVEDSVDLDEELGLWEERDLLLSRLLECKTFKDVAGVFDRLVAAADLTVARRAGLEERFLDLSPDLLAGTTPAQLHRAFCRAAAPRPAPTVSLTHLTDVRASVTEAIAELVEALPARGRASFRQLTRGLTRRVEIVVRFLAVLELYKQGLVELDQVANFGELTVSWIGSSERHRDVALAGVDVYEG